VGLGVGGGVGGGVDGAASVVGGAVAREIVVGGAVEIGGSVPTTPVRPPVGTTGTVATDDGVAPSSFV
jgi:hypothetical protein